MKPTRLVSVSGDDVSQEPEFDCPKCGELMRIDGGSELVDPEVVECPNCGYREYVEWDYADVPIV